MENEVMTDGQMMAEGCMMNGGMMGGMMIFGLLLVVLIVLGIAAAAKYLFFSR